MSPLSFWLILFLSDGISTVKQKQFVPGNGCGIRREITTIPTDEHTVLPKCAIQERFTALRMPPTPAKVELTTIDITQVFLPCKSFKKEKKSIFSSSLTLFSDF